MKTRPKYPLCMLVYSILSSFIYAGIKVGFQIRIMPGFELQNKDSVS